MLQNLKIYKNLADIIKSVEKNNLTIISTATGSGKTIGVPVTISNIFNKRVYVTMPRVLIAKNAYKTVKSLILNNPSSTEIGCMTGKFNSNIDTAKVIFCTEQSFVNRITLNSETDILVIDEVHEQNCSTEQVLYIAKQYIEIGGKVVIMSATMDCERIATYYNTSYSIIQTFDDRMFETTIIDDKPMISTVIELGGRTLIGVGGKEEMSEIKNRLISNKYSNPIFELHSEIEEWEEQEIMSYEDECVIIATSVAMSGITFKDLDNVVPPIYGKQVIQNVLKEYVLSKYEALQWEGRVGRTKEGTVIRIDSHIERPSVPIPEILRTDTTEIVLSFLNKGINLKTIKLLNHPNESDIDYSFTKLRDCGIIDENDNLTEIGQFICNTGEGISKGYMIYQGIKHGIENFARKCATLIEVGNPFYKFQYEKFRNFKTDIKSDHFKIISIIESDLKELNPNLNPNFKEYIKNENIKYKSYKLLKKEFEKIDLKYKNEFDLSSDKLNSFFGSQLRYKIFLYDRGVEFNAVTQTYNGDKYYGDATPVKLKRGMLMDMTSECI